MSYQSNLQETPHCSYLVVCVMVVMMGHLDLEMCSRILQPLNLSLDERLYLEWKIWDAWQTSRNVHLDASAFKAKLLNEGLYLEMEDLGHLANILKYAPELLSTQN